MAEADDSRPAGATRSGSDDELLALAKEHVGSQYGLTPAQARRLVGSSADELRRDARAMAVELGIEVDDEHDDRQRDGQGRFAGAGMNQVIRRASGRSV